MMGTALAVWRADVGDLMRSRAGLTIVLVHLAVVGAAVLLSWPSGYVLGSPLRPTTLAWWGYAETLAVVYLAFAIGSQAIVGRDPIGTGEWLMHPAASPLGMLVGRALATFTCVGVFVLSAAPLAVLAIAAGMGRWDQLAAFALCAAVWILLGATVGTLLCTLAGGRGTRAVGVDVILVLLFVATALGSVGSGAAGPALPALRLFDLNPLRQAAVFLGQEAGGGAGGGRWSPGAVFHVGAYLAGSLAAGALAVWRMSSMRRSVPGQGGVPAEPRA